MSQPLVSIRDLTVSVPFEGTEKILVNKLSLDIPHESIVGLVGASGSGKTTTGVSILRLLPTGLNIKQGQIFFEGNDLLACDEEQMRKYRGAEISMIFQEPLNAFNPVFSIGQQIKEVLQIHTKLSKRECEDHLPEYLRLAGLKDPERVARSYPHQLSGGMRQRAMIAQAIAANPKLIIADEPTSNLDVTLQAKMMELFEELCSKLKLSILLITHDLGMVEHMADHVAVMKEGHIVESGKTQDIIANAKHPYTQNLLKVLH